MAKKLYRAGWTYIPTRRKSKQTDMQYEHNEVVNTYQKGDLYIVYTSNEKSYKYPIADIFRVIEDYGHHGR